MRDNNNIKAVGLGVALPPRPKGAIKSLETCTDTMIYVYQFGAGTYEDVLRVVRYRD